MARRKLDVFNLSFLDVMACGLGAIVLFYMIINAQVAQRVAVLNEDLLAESSRLEEEVLDGRKDMVRVRVSLESKQLQQRATVDEDKRLREMIERLVAEMERAQEQGLAQNESIEDLQADIERLDAAKKRLDEQAQQTDSSSGDRIREFVGDGNRQYLTGMNMGGKRVLILLDSSTSMLARTYVNVLRFRNMNDELKLQAPKWQQAVEAVDWLTTFLKPGVKFQLYTFNEEVASAIPGTEGQWLDVKDGALVTEAIETVNDLVPGRGSNLYRAFEAAKQLSPAPDNIFLLTDGLPTQGKVVPAKTEMVKWNRRIDLFNKAKRQLPQKVSVNVLLFPMDGDPDAAAHYWMLTAQSGGSLLTPTRDWP